MKPAALFDQLALPVIAAPMFIVSSPELVVAQCRAGVLGSFPALNPRATGELEVWIDSIREGLGADAATPFAVNLIANRQSNARLDADLDVCIRKRVPVIITSMGLPADFVADVHAYGGRVLHDVISVRHAEKALGAGVDGLILVAAGAGGHGGTLNPLAFVQEVRTFYDGLLALAGCIANGRGVFAAQAMGADLAYVGTRFVATREANAPDRYKGMIVGSRAADIVYTPYFSGVPANYLKASIVSQGLDPEALLDAGHRQYVAGDQRPKAWRDIWGAGQGVGAISDIPTTAELVQRMRMEYLEALRGAEALRETAERRPAIAEPRL